MCKGADSIMLPRIDVTKTFDKIVNDHLLNFSHDGLRTLVLAQKNLSLKEYTIFE